MTAKASHVGERRCVDAFVFCTWRGRRWLAMVERGDLLGWAGPGGGVDAGESDFAAMRRELLEETGLVVPDGVVWLELARRRVPDPRETPDAFYTTTPFVHHMGPVDDLPPLTAGTAAADACWVRSDTYTDLVDHVEISLGGVVFPAHVQMIRDVIAATP